MGWINVPDYPSPNDDEPKSVYRCDCCGDGIYVGDYYIDYDGDKICWNCITDMKKEVR